MGCDHNVMGSLMSYKNSTRIHRALAAPPEITRDEAMQTMAIPGSLKLRPNPMLGVKGFPETKKASKAKSGKKSRKAKKGGAKKKKKKKMK